MSSFRKSCLPSVGPPGWVAADDAVGVEVNGEIMRALLCASGPHVEAVVGRHRARGGRDDPGLG